MSKRLNGEKSIWEASKVAERIRRKRTTKTTTDSMSFLETIKYRRRQYIMAIYFTGDLHFGHKSIINYDSRPFFSVSEMNTELIKRWNNKVSGNDTVYILGDISWCNQEETIKIFKQLKGYKNLIKGNHDRITGELRKYFENVWDYREIKVPLADDTIRKCILSHYPIHFYNSHYHNAIMLHGHTHNTQEQKYVEYISKWLNENNCPVEIYNVGCMFYNYEPVTLDEILEK